MNLLRLLLASVLLAAACSISSVTAASPGDARAAAGSGGVNSAGARRQPYLLLVSIDGYRWDYLERYPTPALQRLVREGVHAESLRPVYPTLTFPNHYSIATGLYPAEHGIVGNVFRSGDGTRWYRYKERAAVQDARWYRGEPIWVAAERAGMVSAAFYFIGSEAAIGGVPPTYWRAYDASVPGDARVAQVLSWLSLPAAQRPHVITLYFEDVDAASHRYGPSSPQNVAAIRAVDGYLQQLLEGIEQLAVRDEVTLVVVSDHGQARYRDDAAPLILSDFLDLDGIDSVDNATSVSLYLPPGESQRAAALCAAINARWRHGRAMRPREAPAAWRLDGEPRLADVIVQADGGYAVLSTPAKRDTINTGGHGWPPDFRDMHGIFIARGPGLAAGTATGTIGAVEIYPLLLATVGLADRRVQRHPSRLLELLDRGTHPLP